MKCPKCGSETATLITRLGAKGAEGFVCWSCHEKLKELTTAEKLLWLAKNFNIKIDGKLLTKIQLYDGLNNKIVFLEISKDIDELIISAYEWAKQREG